MHHAMRFRTLLPVLLLVHAGAAEPAIGDTRAAVEAELGSPSATKTAHDAEISLYARGTVTYRQDRVVALKLIGAEEWRRRVEQEKAEAAAARARAERLAAERTRRREEAKAACAALLADPALPLLSTLGRIERLEGLLRDHPEADVAHLLFDLRRKYASELEAKKLSEEADRAKIALARQVANLVTRIEFLEKAQASDEKAAIEAKNRITGLENTTAGLDGRMGIMENIVRTRVVYPAAPVTPTKTSIEVSGAGIVTGSTAR